MSEMMDKLDLYKLSGLNQFLNLDLEELFQDEFTKEINLKLIDTSQSKKSNK